MISPIGIWTGLYTPAFHQAILQDQHQAERQEIDQILGIIREPRGPKPIPASKVDIVDLNEPIEEIELLGAENPPPQKRIHYLIDLIEAY